jgi:hypothetical protein
MVTGHRREIEKDIQTIDEPENLFRALMSKQYKSQ